MNEEEAYFDKPEYQELRDKPQYTLKASVLTSDLTF